MIKRSLNGAMFATPIAAVVLGLTALSASAQITNGSITVQTEDASKALVPGTRLVLTDNQTNVVREGKTLGSGTYIFGALNQS
jgi:hypothetical protein